MSWKNIIAFADGSEAGLARVRMGFDLASESQAHLEARHLYKVWAAPTGVGAAAVQDAYAELLAMADAEALKAIEALRIPGANFSVHAQSNARLPIADAAAIAARRSDLAIAGLPEREDEDSIVHGALLGGGAATLLLPNWISPRGFGKRVLVGWKGSPQAARAVRAALPILAKADSVRILVLDPGGEDAGESDEAMQYLAACLARHGVKVGAPLLMKSSLEEAAEALENEAEEFGAELLVLGAYAHSRAREWVFGGVTRHMLKRSRLPLFLAH
jgi:nucleotide-binding universal stress UspA family protein